MNGGNRGLLGRGRLDQAADFLEAIVDLDAPLLQRVAVADRDRAVGERLAVDGDAERRADFVLAAIAAADRALLVVEDVEVRLQVAIDLAGPPRACRPS